MNRQAPAVCGGAACLRYKQTTNSIFHRDNKVPEVKQQKRLLASILPFLLGAPFVCGLTAPAAEAALQPPQIVQFQYPLTNGAWGFPQGKERRIKPFVLMCVHIAGNRRTATMPDGVKPGSGTWAEVSYMARDRHWKSEHPDRGNSAHSYISRDGQVLDCIPTRLAAWNNGDVKKPNTNLTEIRHILELRAQGKNANEAYVREIECTGFSRALPLTAQQRETVAYLIAHDSIEWGIPISRETVHMHADVNSIDKQSCPFTGDREPQIAAIISRAQELRELLMAKPK